VSAIGFGIREMLPSVKLDDQSAFGTEQIDFHPSLCLEWDRKFCVEQKAAGGCGKRLQTPIKECLGGAACSGKTFGIAGRSSGRVNEEVGQGHVNTIANEPTDARGVVLFPFWINWQRHSGGPSRDSAGWQ